MGKEVWMWLAAGLGYGAVNTGELLASCPGGAEQVEEYLGSPVLDEILTQKQAEKLASSRPSDFAQAIFQAQAQGVYTIPFNDPLYPEMLRSIYNPPLVLFVKGELGLLNGQLSIGMVGTRRPSAYGVEAVKAIGRGVALGGAIIISGLASGLDSEAHKAALAVNGPTIACIGFGHDHCYPAGNRKLMEIIERTGAVVSEYPPDTKPEKPYFLHRNRIIAGLSHGLVVCEARKQSGTMSTVNYAIDYGREVFAVPGSIFSELSGGTNAMIREGAYLAGAANDILSVYGVELKEEDPVQAVARQAAKGRPEAAEIIPSPWHIPVAEASAPEQVAQGLGLDLSNQTLGEALLGQLGHTANSGPVSSRQAIEAFKKLQQQSLPETANDSSLEERAAAVNDDVSFSRTAQPPKPPSGPEEEPKVKPYSWDRVEHISKQEVERSSRTSEASFEWAPSAPAARPKAPGTGPVEPVARVGAVEQVWKVTEVLPAQAAPAGAAPGKVQASSPRPQPTVQRPVSAAQQQERQRQAREETARLMEQPVYAPPTGMRSRPAATKEETELSRAFTASLSEKLRTVQRRSDSVETVQVDFSAQNGTLQETYSYTQIKAGGSASASALQEEILFDLDEAEQSAPDLLAGLSEAAKKAYRQLGPQPVSLSAICEMSGLASGEAMAALTELELQGLSRQLAGRQFVIMQ